MKRFNCVAFILIAASIAPIAITAHTTAKDDGLLTHVTQSLDEEAVLENTQAQHNAPSQSHDTDSEEYEDDEDDEDDDDSKLSFWARVNKKYQQTKIVSKMLYNAKVRPFIREHKKMLYGTAGVTSALLLLCALKKLKEK